MLADDEHDRRARSTPTSTARRSPSTAGNVEILARSQATVTADTLTIAIAVALGVAGGVSDARVFVNGHTQAYLGTLAEVIADAGAREDQRDLELHRDGDRRTAAAARSACRSPRCTGTGDDQHHDARVGRRRLDDPRAGRRHHGERDEHVRARRSRAPPSASSRTADVTATARRTRAPSRRTSGRRSARRKHRRPGRDRRDPTGQPSTIDVKASLISPISATGRRPVDLARRADSKTKSTATATQTVRAYVGDGGKLTAQGRRQRQHGREREHAGRRHGDRRRGRRSASATSGADGDATLNPTVKTFTERTSSLGGDDVTLTSTLNLTRPRRADQADGGRRPTPMARPTRR